MPVRPRAGEGRGRGVRSRRWRLHMDLLDPNLHEHQPLSCPVEHQPLSCPMESCCTPALVQGRAMRRSAACCWASAPSWTRLS
eukprot:364847-Chlamydomonas_euryale.AAC.6